MINECVIISNMCAYVHERGPRQVPPWTGEGVLLYNSILLGRNFLNQGSYIIFIT